MALYFTINDTKNASKIKKPVHMVDKAKKHLHSLKQALLLAIREMTVATMDCKR
jgi:hypothetical protein